MGRGRGRQVVSVAKTADVIVIMSKYQFGKPSFRIQRLLTLLIACSGRHQIRRAEEAIGGRVGSSWYQTEYQSPRR